MSRVAIITSITDGYETLKKIRPQFGIDVEWIAVTDGKEEREADHGWEIKELILPEAAGPGVRVAPADTHHPNRLAKVVKCLPWIVTGAEYSIWIDGAYRVTSPVFAMQVVSLATPIAQFLHPWRDCLYAEAVESMRLSRYDDQHEVIGEQAAEYELIGHPPNWGLWATGVIVRKHTADIRVMGEQWLSEIRRHSYQDQVSEPLVLRMCDLRPQALPGDHIQNPWLSYEGSARHG